MATSRNGGVHPLDAFSGSTRIHGRALSGGTFILGVARFIMVANGGVHLLSTFASGGRGPRTTSKSGGVHLLSAFSGSAKSTSTSGNPQVSNQTPAPNATIYPGDTISFDISDIVSLFFVEIQVDQIRREVVHDGDGFLTPYQTSIRIPIVGGWRYQVRRTGGWIAPPTFHVRAFDVNLVEG